MRMSWDIGRDDLFRSDILVVRANTLGAGIALGMAVASAAAAVRGDPAMWAVCAMSVTGAGVIHATARHVRRRLRMNLSRQALWENANG